MNTRNVSVLLIGFFQETYMPFMKAYENVLDELGVSYDKLCFDQEDNGEAEKNGNTYTFRYQIGKRIATSKISKFLPYFYYKRFVEQLIKKNQYKKLIVLTTTPAVLISRMLMQRYQGTYIFDYRDYTYCEQFPVYRKLVNRIAAKSYATFVSSKGFLGDYIEESKNVHVVHNVSNEKQAKEHAIEMRYPICIGFVGVIRYFDVNSKLIDAFANSEQYRLKYAGICYDDCNLEAYCLQEGITNVVFSGKFSNSKKAYLYEGVHLINAMYSLASYDTKRAMPNKLYDCAIFKIPILVTKGTYLGDVVEKRRLGLSIDVTGSPESMAKQIEEYVRSYNREVFSKSCDDFLRDVEEDQRAFSAVLTNFSKI